MTLLKRGVDGFSYFQLFNILTRIIPVLQWKSGFMRIKASMEGNNLVVFYYLSTSDISIDKEGLPWSWEALTKGDYCTSIVGINYVYKKKNNWCTCSSWRNDVFKINYGWKKQLNLMMLNKSFISSDNLL